MSLIEEFDILFKLFEVKHMQKESILETDAKLDFHNEICDLAQAVGESAPQDGAFFEYTKIVRKAIELIGNLYEENKNLKEEKEFADGEREEMTEKLKIENGKVVALTTRVTELVTRYGYLEIENERLENDLLRKLP